jgi:hypothetical protein
MPRVQAMLTRWRWFAGLRNPYARRASSLASRFRLSEVAFVIPAVVSVEPNAVRIEATAKSWRAWAAGHVKHAGTQTGERGRSVPSAMG